MSTRRSRVASCSPTTVRNSIDIACRLIEANVPPKALRRPRRR